jgi:zinc transporter 2
MMLTIGVAIAATIIYCCGQDWVIVDPICTFIFSAIVFTTVTPIMKKCTLVLMEAAPPDSKIDELTADIKAVPNVKSIHDFHLWQISVGKVALSCHIDSSTPMKSLKDV